MSLLVFDQCSCHFLSRCPHCLLHICAPMHVGLKMECGQAHCWANALCCLKQICYLKDACTYAYMGQRDALKSSSSPGAFAHMQWNGIVDETKDWEVVEAEGGWQSQFRKVFPLGNHFSKTLVQLFWTNRIGSLYKWKWNEPELSVVTWP